jgi:tetratricopeptide (TPR) repeat protein
MRSPKKNWLVWLILFPLIFSVVVDLAPLPKDLAVVWRNYYHSYHEKQYLEEARWLEEAAHWQPWRDSLWESVGAAAEQAGQWNQVISAYQRVHQSGKISKEGEFSLGEAYRQLGKTSEALDIWKELLQKENPPLKTYSALFSLQTARNDLVGGQETLRLWMARVPNNAEASFQLALLKLLDKPSDARSLLQQAILWDAGWGAKAQIIQKHIRNLSENTPPGFQNVIIGRAFASVGNWQLARIAFDRAVQSDAQYAEAWAFLGEADQQVGEDGKTELDRAVELNPKSAIVNGLTALYWRRLGHPERAIPYLYTAAEAEPDTAAWEAEIGNALADMGDLEMALDHYRRATKLEPENSLYWQLLAQYCMINQVYLREIGLPAARQAYTLEPSSAPILDLYGWILYRLEDSVGAERFLQRSQIIDPVYSASYLHLGQIYLEMGHMDKAYLQLRRASELTRPDDEVGKLVQRLLKRYFGGG